MKHGSITLHLRRKSSENNGLKGENRLQRRRRLHLLARSWYQFFVMHVVKTINGEYYANLFQRLNDSIKKKWPHLAKKKVLFHQDNVSVQTSLIAMAKIDKLKFKLLSHAPYSPDSAPSGYFFFPILKK